MVRCNLVNMLIGLSITVGFEMVGRTESCRGSCVIVI